jgi:hypothetical protein
MIITVNKSGLAELKTKKASILFNGQISINDVSLEGAGEYEIGEVSVQGIEDYLYILNSEDLTIGVLDYKCKISKEQTEALSDADVLIVRINGEVKEAVEQVNQIGPKTAIYLGSEGSMAKLQAAGIDFDSTDQIKLTKNDLELEGKSFFMQLNGGEHV